MGRSNRLISARRSSADIAAIWASETPPSVMEGASVPRALEVALDEAFSTGRVNRDEVRAVLDGHPNAPGAGTLRQLTV